MKLVLATLYIMLQNGYQHTQEIRIDAKACNHQYKVEVDGSSGFVGIKCRG